MDGCLKKERTKEMTHRVPTRFPRIFRKSSGGRRAADCRTLGEGAATTCHKLLELRNPVVVGEVLQGVGVASACDYPVVTCAAEHTHTQPPYSSTRSSTCTITPVYCWFHSLRENEYIQLKEGMVHQGTDPFLRRLGRQIPSVLHRPESVC